MCCITCKNWNIFSLMNNTIPVTIKIIKNLHIEQKISLDHLNQIIKHIFTIIFTLQIGLTFVMYFWMDLEKTCSLTFDNLHIGDVF